MNETAQDHPDFERTEAREVTRSVLWRVNQGEARVSIVAGVRGRDGRRSGATAAPARSAHRASRSPARLEPLPGQPARRADPRSSSSVMRLTRRMPAPTDQNVRRATAGAVTAATPPYRESSFIPPHEVEAMRHRRRAAASPHANRLPGFAAGRQGELDMVVLAEFEGQETDSGIIPLGEDPTVACREFRFAKVRSTQEPDETRHRSQHQVRFIGVIRRDVVELPQARRDVLAPLRQVVENSIEVGHGTSTSFETDRVDPARPGRKRRWICSVR